MITGNRFRREGQRMLELQLARCGLGRSRLVLSCPRKRRHDRLCFGEEAPPDIDEAAVVGGLRPHAAAEHVRLRTQKRGVGGEGGGGGAVSFSGDRTQDRAARRAKPNKLAAE